MPSPQGKLIVLYGINNLGKTTQAKLLVEKLKANEYPAEYLKYPIYDLEPSGKILNDYLRNSNPNNLTAREAQIIYALNRTQYQAILVAKLEAGINIVAEDYKGTGIAWGLGAGVEEKFLKKINSHLIEEDLVFLFDGKRFRQSIEKNHKHENDEELITKVRWAHLKLGEEGNWIKINANDSIEEIQKQIWKLSSELLKSQNPQERKSLDDIKTKNNYNYSGFKPLHEIIKHNYSQSFPIKSKTINENNYSQKNIIMNSSQEEKTRLKLKIEKLNPQAKLPQVAHNGDAGYDLYANDYYSLQPYEQTLISTGLRIAIPEGYVGLIWDKSGLASNGITTMGGVIDANYRGELKVVLKNLSEEIFNIAPGQKIAQILIQKISNLEISEEKLDNHTERQDRGFGSSGQF